MAVDEVRLAFLEILIDHLCLRDVSSIVWGNNSSHLQMLSEDANSLQDGEGAKRKSNAMS